MQVAGEGDGRVTFSTGLRLGHRPGRAVSRRNIETSEGAVGLSHKSAVFYPTGDTWQCANSVQPKHQHRIRNGSKRAETHRHGNS